MINFDISGLEELERSLDWMNLQKLIGAVGVLALFFIFIFGVILILLWIFGSIGLMNEAKKNNIPASWLAFLPVGRSYIIGKLGFDIHASKKNETFVWLTLGLGAAAFIFGKGTSDIHQLATLGLIVFESWAFYNIFNKLAPSRTTLYTIFTVLTSTLLGGVFLYFIKSPEVVAVSREPEKNKKADDKKNDSEKKNPEVKKDNKKETKNNYCQYCGTKLNKGANFCPECGKKVSN